MQTNSQRIEFHTTSCSNKTSEQRPPILRKSEKVSPDKKKQMKSPPCHVISYMRTEVSEGKLQKIKEDRNKISIKLIQAPQILNKCVSDLNSFRK